MKIVIDFVHPADVNFYKNALNILQKRDVEIDLIVRPRGKLLSILQRELSYPDLKIIGKHDSNIHGKIFGLIKRDLDLIFYLSKINFDVSTSFGFQISHVSQILGKPSVAFHDDYEYKIPFYLMTFSATRFVIPNTIPATGRNIYKYNGFKELAYLHPNYFTPNKKVLEKYGLKQNKYVFIREVSSASLNYKKLVQRLHEVTGYLRNMEFEIVASLEDKSVMGMFKKDCIILEEPVDDIYSLLSFAALTISSGDTMARESCLVGTPTIYTGGRDMCVNDELIRKNCMFKVDDIEKVPIIVKYIIENDLKKNIKDIIDHCIKYEWEDTTQVIIDNLMGVVQ